MASKNGKILILTERFFPEEFLVNDLASEWKRRGHAVEVLTQAPSYPFDKVFEGYRNRFYQTTTELNGIPVHRVSAVLGYNKRVTRKIWNYVHFAFLTSCWALFNGWRYKRVFIYHTGPLTMASAAVVFHYLWWRRCTIWTQDLWPDAVYAYGFKPSPLKRLLLNTFVRFIYSSCRTITVSCRGFIGRIREITGREAEFVPQWDVGTPEIPPRAPDGKTVFLFAGNLGVPQALPNVIEGFVRARLDDAELHLVGGGVMLEALRKQVAELGAKNIVFHGRQPRAKMPAFFARADVLVISLSEGYRLTLPGKFQTYLKTRRPLFGILYGDVRELIIEHHLGEVAIPEDIEEIARGFIRSAERNRSGGCAEAGKNARALSDGAFSRSYLIGRLASCAHIG